ncbi:MAG TPA: serine/threonine-protein kinase [Gaiellaceae bacterium]|nr:serine/threonine-protein kinase [Gaiellaceae bacterium]
MPVQHALALDSGHLVLGRYRPLRPLGSGGSGSVWLARDEHAAREVALKVVAREGKAGQRAEREVEAATRLRHPRCLRALALARDEGHVYVAYPYVPGQTLRDALRAGALDDASALETAAQVLEALGHAHGQKIVHRDVKPANIMLEEGDEVSVRLLDFGLAQIDQADTLTAAGDVPGTLAYIAPERLAGEEATGAADVWSAGVLLWEALAGRHPFWSASPLETARRVEEGARPLAELRPDLPRSVTRTVDRMLAVEPRKRPSAKQAAGLLRTAGRERLERRRAATSPATLRERAPHAALAAVLAAGSALLFPFFPAGWPLLLGALAAGAAVVSPPAGLAAALAVPVLPLGNVALGLAAVYLVTASLWFLLFARDARAGLLFLAGPLLALAHALPLVAIVALAARGPLRRGAVAGAAGLAAVAVAAAAGRVLPLTGEAPAEARGLAGRERPAEAVDAVLSVLAAHPTSLVAALVLALAAVAAPAARERGLWGVAAWGTAFLAALVLGPTAFGGASVAAGVAVPTVWAATGALAYPLARVRR